MTTSQRGIELLKEFEGCLLKAYQDIAGVWTIGYGTTTADWDITGRDIVKGMEITQETADRWLTESLKVKYEPLVFMYDTVYHWNQNEFDALVSFAYNLGTISGLTAKGTRSRAEIAEKWTTYNHAGGREVAGLTARRKKELALFLTPVTGGKKPMGKTSTELVAFAKSKVGTPYVYGAHGEVLTQSQVNAWAATYPNVYTASYIAKAKKFIGVECTDCAGLIDWFMGGDRNAQYYRDSAVERVPISRLDETMVGWAVWKSGHIGIYIGDGKVVEAKGINYGTIISNVKDTAWKEVCKLRGVDYAEPERPKLNIIPCSSESGLIVTAKSLNIRDYPKIGAVIGAYSGGSKVYPTGKVYVSDTEVWIQTNKGYISRKYLKGWITEQEGKWYVESGDNYPHGTMREIGGSVYYFNDAGWLETGRDFTVRAAADGSLSVV